MARSNGAMSNGGWPPQRTPNAEPDPRTGRPMQPQQRPAQGGGYAPQHPQQHARPGPQQAAPGNMYPPVGYPEQPQPNAPQGYPPQQAYHYPQQSQPAPVTAPPRPRNDPRNDPRQDLSSLESAVQSAQQGYGGYAQPQTQPGYGARRPAAPAQPNYGATPTTQPRQPAPQPRQPNPGFRQSNAAGADYAARQPAEPRTAPPRYDHWPPAQAPAPRQPQPSAPQTFGAPDPNGYDLGSYMPAGHETDGLPQDLSQADPLQQQAAWMHPAQPDYGDAAAMEQAFQAGDFQTGDMGYDQGQGTALEPTYNPDDAAEYEYEEPKRGSWALRIAGAVVVAIGLGYGLAQGYQMVMGSSSSNGETPVVRSTGEPARTKPTDPGGREFAHTDSKIMGRLGDGGAEKSADSSGTRKVQTVQVGRDGSIVPPAAPASGQSSSSEVSVPGVTVIDGFGGNGYGGSVTTTTASAPEPPSPPKVQTASTSKPIVVNPPSSSSSTAPPPPSAKPDVIAKAAPSKPKTTAKKVATAAVSSSSGADGYVVVLASVPASSQSRLNALRKFADMQQQYGTVLQNKTPDVREANLGDRGTYHRLLVGPPSSRSQASQLCSQLKTAGYKDCWVMAY